jgi:hypothetical protein
MIINLNPSIESIVPDKWGLCELSVFLSDREFNAGGVLRYFADSVLWVSGRGRNVEDFRIVISSSGGIWGRVTISAYEYLLKTLNFQR